MADSSWSQVPVSASAATQPPPGGGSYAFDSPASAAQASALPLAGFWIRFVGLVVDGILFYVVNLILSTVFLSTATTTVDGLTITTRTGPTGLIELVLLLLELAYCTWFWSNQGATLGQMVVGIKVVDAESGGMLRPSQAVIRYFGYIISGIPILLGFIWAAFDPKKQGWMDKIAGTLVVKAR